MIRVAILGASGFAGGELIKLGLRHGNIEFVALHSENHAGEPVTTFVPEAPASLRYVSRTVAELNADKPDVVFCAMPAGFAKETAPRLQSRVIDLSHDFRLDPQAPYGLPELFRDKIRNARLVANPGCYATASILSAWPLIRAEVVTQMVFDGKSGYSGAGRAPSYVNDPAHYTDNVLAYKLTRHPHASEIQHVLARAVSFTPHVLPLFRGLLVTAHVFLKPGALRERPSLDEGGGAAAPDARIREYFHDTFGRERFIRILDDRLPELHDVQGTNLCAIGGFEVDANGRAVIVATIDNLVKGAAGQALQNLNIMCGEPEERGLADLAPLPPERRGA